MECFYESASGYKKGSSRAGAIHFCCTIKMKGGQRKREEEVWGSLKFELQLRMQNNGWNLISLHYTSSRHVAVILNLGAEKRNAPMHNREGRTS